MIIQVGFGNVYKVVGALIGIYMAGMSVGAYLAGKPRLTSRTYGMVQCGLALALLFSSLVMSIPSMSSTAVMVALAASLSLGSLCAGAVFSLTARMRAVDPVASGSRLYALDLLGSAIGALLVGPFLLPLFGVHAVANAATGLVVVGAVISLTSPMWRLYEKA